MDRADISLIALRRILRATELYGRDLAKAAGLTPVQFRVLQVITEKGGHCTAKQIATQMGVSQATVTTLVDKLVARGMVTRTRSDKDRRSTDIALTETGHATMDRAPDALQQRYVREFERLDDWEQAFLVAALERVAQMLDASDMDAAPVLDMGELHKRN